MCKLTNIMNKLHDNQLMILYVGTDVIYKGTANKLYLNIDEKYFDIEIDTIGTDIITIDDKRYIALLVYFCESKLI